MRRLFRGEVVWVKYSEKTGRHWPGVVFEVGDATSENDIKYNIVWFDGTFTWNISERRILPFSENWLIRLDPPALSKKFTAAVNKAIELLYEAADPNSTEVIDHYRIATLGNMSTVLHEEQLRALSGNSRHDHYWARKDPLDKETQDEKGGEGSTEVEKKDGNLDRTSAIGESSVKRLRRETDALENAAIGSDRPAVYPGMSKELTVRHPKMAWVESQKQFRISQVVWARCGRPNYPNHWPAIIIRPAFRAKVYEVALLHKQITIEVEAADIEDFVHSWSRFACGSDSEQFIVGLRWAVFAVFRFVLNKSINLEDIAADLRLLDLNKLVQPMEIARVPREFMEEFSGHAKPLINKFKYVPIPQQQSSSNFEAPQQILKRSAKKTIRR